MTTVTITGTIASGYRLNAPITELRIARTGYVEGGVNYGVSWLAFGSGYTLANQGRIKGGKFGVELGGPGTIFNGSSTDTAATITGGLAGIYAFVVNAIGVRLVNFGTISSTAPTGAFASGTFTAGVYLGAITNGLDGRPGKANLVNGSLADTTATIEGGDGIRLFNIVGPIHNFGTVKGTGVSSVEGVGVLADVVNGAPIDTAAYIYGYHVGAQGMVTNYATIKSHGIGLVGSGVNGVSTGSGALIEGSTGVALSIYDTFSNFGTVVGTNVGVQAGSSLPPPGPSHLYNGGAADASALIEGATGVNLSSLTFVTNLGTIIGTQASTGSVTHAGVLGQAFIVNGSTANATALIEGVDVGVGTSGKVRNYGTIEATAAGGYAVKLTSAKGILQVEAGSKLVGKVSGGGGTLELASAMGVVSSIGGGTIIADGVDYPDFGTLEVTPGGTITVTGVGTIASGGVAKIAVLGALDVAGTLIVSGTLSEGRIGGAGHLDFEQGTSTIDTGVDLTTAHVLVSGASTAIDVVYNYYHGAVTVTGAWDQTAGTVNVDVKDSLRLTGAGDKLSGTLAGAGTVSLTGPGDTLSGLTLTVAKTAINAASVNLSGIIDVATVLALTSPDVKVSGITQFTGGGLIQLARLASNEIVGAAATSLLENSDRIVGGGQLGGGQMRLTNEAAGAIQGFGAAALVIDTGTNVVSNAGLIESSGAGGLTIDGAVANTGLLEARGGALTVDGAVAGAGKVSIYGATASFAGAFSENVAFTNRGELALAQSQAYSGTISGFSKSGATSLDLEDISFTGASASYSGTKTSGVLTVTDGTHTARIDFLGNYTASTWALGDDGHGGVTVTDPPTASPHLLTSAIAGFAPKAAMSAGPGQLAGVSAPLLLATPG